MKEILLNIVKIGLPLSVVAVMFAQGLNIVPSQLLLFRERPFLLLRSLAVVLLLVPIAVLAIILLLNPAPNVTIGLAILVASPAAPVMLVKVPGKGGSLAYMASLHLSLALLAIFTVPTTLYLLSVALGFHVEVDLFAVEKVVGMTILLPVGFGLLIHSFFPKAADTIGPVLSKAGRLALLVFVLFVMAMTYGVLLKMDAWSYFVICIVVIVSLAIGHLLGPGDGKERTTLAMESAARHPGLAMTIATLNFSQQQALPVLIPYLIVFVAVTTVYLQWRKRRSAE
jgi:bile acid:Na+ symporter, BASS family